MVGLQKGMMITVPDSSISTLYGPEIANVVETDITTDLLYHLVLAEGSKTYAVSGVFVSGWCDNEAFLNYIEE